MERCYKNFSFLSIKTWNMNLPYSCYSKIGSSFTKNNSLKNDFTFLRNSTFFRKVKKGRFYFQGLKLNFSLPCFKVIYSSSRVKREKKCCSSCSTLLLFCQQELGILHEVHLDGQGSKAGGGAKSREGGSEGLSWFTHVHCTKFPRLFPALIQQISWPINQNSIQRIIFLKSIKDDQRPRIHFHFLKKGEEINLQFFNCILCEEETEW